MSKVITATFKTREAAFAAMRQMEAVGITEEQISLVVTDETRGRSFNIDEGTKADEGAAAGATFGGIVGGVLAALAGAGALAFPGLNLVVSGAIVSGLAGAGAGAATGGLVGLLVGAGIKEHEAKIYEDEVKTGAILMAVKTENSEQKKAVENILEHSDSYNLAA